MKKQSNTPKRKTLLRSLLSGRRIGFWDSEKSETNPSQGSRLWNIYTSARTLPFDKFQEICVEDKLELLVINGEPPIEELISGWVKIYWEYSETLDGTLVAKMQTDIERNALIAKINVVELIIGVLSLKYYQSLVDILKGYNFRGTFDFSDQEGYINDLKKCKTQLKFWKMKVEPETKKSNGNEKPTYEYFASALSSLSQYSKYLIRAKDLTAFDFAVQYKNMIAYLKRQ